MARSLVRIKLNRNGVRDLLRSDEMREVLRSRGDDIAAAAGPGHRVDATVGNKRARAAVVTDTDEAVWGELKNRSLTRAVDAAK